MRAPRTAPMITNPFGTIFVHLISGQIGVFNDSRHIRCTWGDIFGSTRVWGFYMNGIVSAGCSSGYLHTVQSAALNNFSFVPERLLTLSATRHVVVLGESYPRRKKTRYNDRIWKLFHFLARCSEVLWMPVPSFVKEISSLWHKVPMIYVQFIALQSDHDAQWNVSAMVM